MSEDKYNYDLHCPKPGLLRFPLDELPFDIGSLEERAFSVLGDWTPERRDDGTTVFIRYGIKQNVQNQGSPATLFLVFSTLFIPLDSKVSSESHDHAFKRVKEKASEAMVVCSTRYASFFTVFLPPPAYMLSELERLAEKQEYISRS